MVLSENHLTGTIPPELDPHAFQLLELRHILQGDHHRLNLSLLGADGGLAPFFVPVVV